MLRKLVVSAVASLVIAIPVSAQLVPSGPEFAVNTYTTGDQLWPSVCAHPDGAFVIAWRSANQDGSSYGVFARRYDSTAFALGGEFQINTYTTGSQSYPELCCADDGFVVVWESRDQDGDSLGVFGRVFDEAGAALTSEFQVNVDTTGLQFTSSVACSADGTFVVVWNHTPGAVRGRRFSHLGLPLGSEFEVAESETELAQGPSVAMQPNDGFVVVWTAYGKPDEDASIYGRRFDSAGTSTGTEFHVNTYSTGGQHAARVSADGQGRFVVSWFSNLYYSYGPSQDGSQAGVFARAFDSSANPVAEELLVNNYTTDHQTRSSIANAGDGRFVVVWESLGVISPGQDGSEGTVVARQLDWPSTLVGNEVVINSYTTDDQLVARAAYQGQGTFIVVWASHAQDGSDHGIFARRVARGETLCGDANGNGQLSAADALIVLQTAVGTGDLPAVSMRRGRKRRNQDVGCTQCVACQRRT